MLCSSMAILSFDKRAPFSSIWQRSKDAVTAIRCIFDMGTLYQTFASTYFVALRTRQPLPESAQMKVGTAFAFLKAFLQSAVIQAGGKQLSVAHVATFTTVSQYDLAGYDWSGFANVTMRTAVPGREINKIQKHALLWCTVE